LTKAVLGHHQVLRLQVAVNDPRGVRLRQPVGNLHGDLQ